MVIDKVEPKCIGILTTMKCTAACQECCFECSPNRKEILNWDQIKSIIDSIAIAFPNTKLIAWTGGECTLLGEDLFRGIAYAKDKGISSRIVSNGWWASSDEKASEMVEKLKKAGLCELNISTGDNHQEYVPEDVAIRAAVTAAKRGITSVIAVEQRANARFNKEDVIKNQIFQKFINEKVNSELINIINPVWVSFHSDNVYDYDNISIAKNIEGCNAIFETLSISNNNEVALCCGLSLDYIPSLIFDNIQSFCDNPLEARKKYYDSFNDFFKIWIYVDGPYRILKQVQQWDSSIECPNFVHQCLYCSYLYNNENVQKVLIENYQKVEKEVMEKFYNKIKWKQIRGNTI